MTNVWFDRDLPVLKAVVNEVEEQGTLFDITRITQATGFDLETVDKAMKALNDSGEYFTKATRDMGGGWYVDGVTGEARRAANLWPTPQGLAELLIAQMERQAEEETNPERKSRMKAFLSGTGQAGRDIAVDVMASVLKQQMGV